MKILACSPWSKVGSNCAKRVVLKVRLKEGNIPVEFVVHDEFLQDERTFYENGSYFPCWSSKQKSSPDFIVCCYKEAFKKWQERSAKETLEQVYDTLFDDFTISLSAS